jgi:hypothetical protein
MEAMSIVSNSLKELNIVNCDLGSLHIISESIETIEAKGSNFKASTESSCKIPSCQFIDISNSGITQGMLQTPSHYDIDFLH